jgi:hypothetical protein
VIIFPLAQPALSVRVGGGDYRSLNLYDHVTGTLGVNVSQANAVIVTISSGAFIVAARTNAAGLTVGNWPATVNLTIVNNGFISGRGGTGGDGGIRNGPVEPTAGGNGTAGIFCTVPCSITNNGLIQGGGGGGGGGKYSINGNGGGGGGGVGLGDGGFGFTNGGQGTFDQGGLGGDSQSSLVPAPGNGGNGGTWLDGGDGAGQAGGASGAAGGQPGKAIDFNGNTVNVTDNGTIFGEES